MVRISKLTDYGMVIMSLLASLPQHRFQAKEIAVQTAVSVPTVSKLLKRLAKEKLLLSYRGIQGGYQLAKAPELISVADLIQALEGPIALTECNLGHDNCPTENLCSIRRPWQQINRVITESLAAIKLSALIQPAPLSGVYPLHVH